MILVPPCSAALPAVLDTLPESVGEAGCSVTAAAAVLLSYTDTGFSTVIARGPRGPLVMDAAV